MLQTLLSDNAQKNVHELCFILLIRFIYSQSYSPPREVDPCPRAFHQFQPIKIIIESSHHFSMRHFLHALFSGTSQK